MALLGALAGSSALAQDALLMHRTAPKFPDRALERGLEAVCTVGFDVLNDGSTSRARACCAAYDANGDRDKPTPRGPFARASVEAVEQWRYRPAAGAPSGVQSTTQTMLEFTLTSGASPERAAPPLSACPAEAGS